MILDNYKSICHSAQVSSYQEDVLLLYKLYSKSSFLTNCPPFVLHFVNFYAYLKKTYSWIRVDILVLSRWMLDASLVPALPVALLQLLTSHPADRNSSIQLQDEENAERRKKPRRAEKFYQRKKEEEERNGKKREEE